MRSTQTQRGFLLIVAVIIIAVAAAMAAAIVTLTTGSGQAGGLQVSSTQALYAAESGLEQSTRQYSAGTGCAALTNAVPTSVGVASYTIVANAFNPLGAARTTLTAVVNPGDTTIPVGDTTNYADHGRIRINGEDILYSGKTATSFTGAVRGYAATTVSPTHVVGSPVDQNLCLIRATGTSDVAVRTLEQAVLAGPWALFVDGGSVNIGVGATTLATLNANLPAGEYLTFATVTLQNLVAGGGARTTINGGTPGNLQLRQNGAAVDWNEYAIHIGPAAIGASARPEKTFFLNGRSTGRPSGDVYTVTAQADNANTFGEAKIVTISNPQRSAFAFNTDGNLATGAQDPITAIAPGFGRGTNLVIGWVQLDNNSGGERTIAAGNLRLSRTSAPATDLAVNQYAFTLRRATSGGGNPNATRGASVLLIGIDNDAPAGATYNVSGRASAANVRAASNLVVIQGLGGDFLDGASTAVGAATPLATNATAFPVLYPGRSNLVFSASHYDNTAAGTRDITTPNEAIVFNGINWATNQYRYRMCDSGTAECRHFTGAGLLWQHTAANANPATNPNANPTYIVRATSSAAGINGEAKILAIHLDAVASRREVFP
jgi:hypothetical protein